MTDYIIWGSFFCVVAFVLFILYAYIYDRYISPSALRRNYPVLIRGRYLLEHAGVFLRQYLFALDREEMPFNRAQRTWVYKAAADDLDTVPFGSTHQLGAPGSPIFLPSMYPTNEADSIPPLPYVIGEHTPNPYETATFFNISGMSFGSLSANAVEALAMGSALADCWINTGEGGVSDYHLKHAKEIVVQIGTAKYGMRTSDGKLDPNKLKDIARIPTVKMFELKIGQGAKPGKGGILPGSKVNKEVAEMRGIPVGQDSASPNRHDECEKPEDILALVKRIREISEKPCGIKIVGGNPLEMEELISQIVLVDGPDFITIDGGEGGTGASPASLIDYVGMPLFESLPILVDLLKQYELYESIEVIASGKLITPDQVALALAHGANFAVSARGPMFALGCIQALECNKNCCPAGITTDNPRLVKGIIPKVKAERVANYMRRMTYEVGVIAHSCGVPNPRALTLDHVEVKH